MAKLPTIKGLSDSDLAAVILHSVAGRSASDICKERKLDPSVVSRALNNPLVKEYINDITSAKVSDALVVLKTESARLMRKAMEVIEKRLDDDDLDAVKLVISNIKPKEMETSADTAIYVNLPTPHITKETKSES